VAAGDHAQAVQHNQHAAVTPHAAQVLELLRSLRERLDEADLDPADREAARDAIAEAETEAGAADPQPGPLRRAALVIAGAVAGVNELATYVVSRRRIIGAWFAPG
jgi:hypothetical protein